MCQHWLQHREQAGPLHRFSAPVPVWTVQRAACVVGQCCRATFLTQDCCCLFWHGNNERWAGKGHLWRQCCSSHRVLIHSQLHHYSGLTLHCPGMKQWCCCQESSSTRPHQLFLGCSLFSVRHSLITPKSSPPFCSSFRRVPSYLLLTQYIALADITELI